MEFETISGVETELAMRGEKIERAEDDDGPKGPVGSAVPTAGAIRPKRGPETDDGGMEPQPA